MYYREPLISKVRVDPCLLSEALCQTWRSPRTVSARRSSRHATLATPHPASAPAGTHRHAGEACTNLAVWQGAGWEVPRVCVDPSPAPSRMLMSHPLWLHQRMQRDFAVSEQRAAADTSALSLTGPHVENHPRAYAQPCGFVCCTLVIMTGRLHHTSTLSEYSRPHTLHSLEFLLFLPSGAHIHARNKAEPGARTRLIRPFPRWDILCARLPCLDLPIRRPSTVQTVGIQPLGSEQRTDGLLHASSPARIDT